MKRFYGQPDDVSDLSFPRSCSSTADADPAPLQIIWQDESTVPTLHVEQWDSEASFVPQSPTLDFEGLALGFFFNRFVILPSSSAAARGFLEVLPSLYLNADTHSALFSATAAIALAVYASDPHREHCIGKARQKYGETLLRVNEALRDPIAARTNETLMSVLIMGLLEIITARREASSRFGVHAEGAMALIKMRGEEMFQSKTSRKLLHAVRSQNIVSHIHQSKPLQDFYDINTFDKINIANTTLAVKANSAHELATISAYIPGLRSRTKALLSQTRLASSDTLALELIERCTNIDGALERWKDNVLTSWQYTTTKQENPSDAYPKTIDHYPDVWVARAWNSYRTARLYVQSIILRSIAWLSGSTVSALADTITPPTLRDTASHARHLLQDMADGICASVPCHMGPSLFRQDGSNLAAACLRSYTINTLDKSLGSPTPNTSAPTPAISSIKEMHEIGGYLLFWPLIVAHSVILIPTAQKAWIRDRVQDIGKHTGLNQVIVAKIAEAPGHPLFDD